jgi:hypothetical protein
MQTKIRTILLTGLFFFGLLTGLQAQDKYDYAVITFNPGLSKLFISVNNTDLKKIEVAKYDLKTLYFDMTPALNEVKKLNTEGWELFDTGTLASDFYLFHLRKKVE